MIVRQVAGKKDWSMVEALYMRAFPADERKPFGMIREKHSQKVTDVWVIEEADIFAGFAVTMNGKDLVLLDYFAVSEEYRGKGLGGKSLRKLQDLYRGKRFFLEVESLKVPADNLEERRRRKNFYLNNGMKALGVYARLFGVDFELLGYECEVSFKEYFALYDEIYGAYASKFLEEITQ